MTNETLQLVISQSMTLVGFWLIAWLVGRSFAKGLAKELKDAVPRWIHKYVSETREAKAISNAREALDENIRRNSNAKTKTN